jgi:LysM repeat protein
MSNSYKITLAAAVLLFVFVVGYYAMPGGSSGGNVDTPNETGPVASDTTDGQATEPTDDSSLMDQNDPADDEPASPTTGSGDATDSPGSSSDRDSGFTFGSTDSSEGSDSTADDAGPDTGGAAEDEPSAGDDSFAANLRTRINSANDADEPDEPTGSDAANTNTGRDEPADPPESGFAQLSADGESAQSTDNTTTSNDAPTNDTDPFGGSNSPGNEEDSNAANNTPSNDSDPTNRAAANTTGDTSQTGFTSLNNETSDNTADTGRANAPGDATGSADDAAGSTDTAGDSEDAVPETYTVQAGDSIWTIAEQFFDHGKHWRAIAQANPMTDPQTLKPGDELRLPDKSEVVSDEASDNDAAAGAGNYTVKPGDTLIRIARNRYDDPSQWRRIYEANRERIGASPDDLQAGMQLMLPPPEGAARQ